MMRISLCILLFTLLFALLVWSGSRLLPESSPVARGAAYAVTRGCTNCHGYPNKKLDDENTNGCVNVNQISGHPEFEINCKDVMAYFETVRLRRSFNQRIRSNPNNPLIVGEHLARKYHCFNCHGHLGQGGFKNAKSFKGYIPGYFGRDFKVLTDNANPDSVRQWLVHGMNPSILAKPLTGKIANFFFDRQAVSMPSFKSLQPQEIEALVKFVIALHNFGPMGVEDVRRYAEKSRSPLDRNLPNIVRNSK